MSSLSAGVDVECVLIPAKGVSKSEVAAAKAAEQGGFRSLPMLECLY